MNDKRIANATGKEMTLVQIVDLTKKFIKLADSLYQKNSITEEEYTEITFRKKNFLELVEKGELLH